MDNQSETPNQNQFEKKIQEQNSRNFRFSNKTVIVISLVVVLVLAGLASAYYISTRNQQVNPLPISQEQDNKKPDTAVTPGTSTSTPDTTTPDQQTTTCSSKVKTTRQLSGLISWIDRVEIPDLDIIFSSQEMAKYTRESSTFYKVGTVQSGIYQGGEFILAEVAFEGPSFYPSYYRFIRQEQNIVVLGKYSGGISADGEFDLAKFKVDKDFTLSDLEYPKTFTGATNRENFELQSYDIAPFCADDLEKKFSHAILGDFYTTKTITNKTTTKDARHPLSENGFYAAAPDGTSRTYKLVIDFVGKDNVPNVFWSDGTVNKQEYNSTDVGGCGSENYASVMDPGKVNVDRDLRLAGQNSFGEPIYEFKDDQNSILQDIYKNQYIPYGEDKLSYEQFAAAHPVFFWKDSFGRLIKFQNNKFVPLAECGKPVIYLYPESKQKVTVKLEPRGGFSYSEPKYGNGWEVEAYPDGRLVDLTTGLQYPYLFWEGRGGLYPGQNKGFVVAQKDLHQFLIEKLAESGLNEKESADFIEFWEPRMQGSPYYFVTFFGNNVMDEIAPLTVSPKPDAIIRVLMDYTPLQNPVAVEGYKIKTPKREGFTVVEWGGVLRSE